MKFFVKKELLLGGGLWARSERR